MNRQSTKNYSAFFLAILLFIALFFSFNSLYVLFFLSLSFLPSIAFLVMDNTKKKAMSQMVLSFNVLAIIPYLKHLKVVEFPNHENIISSITVDTLLKIYSISVIGAVLYGVIVLLFKSVVKIRLFNEEMQTKKVMEELMSQWKM